ncbi:cyanase [Dietzia psychralcaliphila]|uniref:Cyanate hydratase n=1 Tax=Dietzia psychralcaliphila TaxID=139021 RepID=A0AAD0NM87_9ACTN|nr:cyanase [Dietzia psychralcaliphila]AWH94497.1 cyanate hydratase [Dietzia psychralcaliphila]PTM88155.1 cyanate lyase [Dietzia psychralcaliphila]
MNTTDPRTVLDKIEAGRIVDAARVRAGKSWEELAKAAGSTPVWTTAALLGMHPMGAEQAAALADLLDLGGDVVEALVAQPTRGDVVGPPPADPTLYRFHEALMVYGPALKALIHEEFGDGIMSAINFQVDIARRSDPGGDRVVVTFDGKFLDYNW